MRKQLKPDAKPGTLGSVLRNRRRQLDISQAEIAKRVGVRANYIGYLEGNKRRPSSEVVVKLAKVLDLDKEELFFLANPHFKSMIGQEQESKGDTWEAFKANRKLHTRHGITRLELEVLSHVARLGEVQSDRDYLNVLNAIRAAVTPT